MRSFEEEQFKCDDSDGIVVDGVGMVESEDDFGGHVGQGTPILPCVIVVKQGGNSKVGDVRKASLIDHDVFWFDVSMNYFFAVYIPDDL